MLLKLYRDNPSQKHIRRTADVLREGGIVIYPTDTVYGLGCDMFKPRAVERLARLKGVDPRNPDLSLICYDMSQVAQFTVPLSNTVFRLMKKNLPGPFTFILTANHQVPKIFQGNKKTVGIRIPDNPILLEIVRELGHPILTTSIHDDDEIIEYTTDPELIYEKYRKQVDLVIDGGYGSNEPSTVVDCTGDEPVIVREGTGILVE
ncbi:MAG TPA: threonylcarbamoyl-AMP synthase [Bacteroidetes bacterium]|nr:threonylcarbamoyl-AMP synthase [Bacteroidota bacterium]